DPRRVTDRLATTELRSLGLQDDRLRAKLADADLEGDPGAGRGLLEDQGDGLALERPVTASGAGLASLAQLQEVPQLLRLKTVEVKEMLRCCCHDVCSAAAKLPAVSSRMPTAVSTSPRPMIRGGKSRTTFSAAPTVKRPRSCAADITSPEGTRHFSPSISPAPLTASKTCGCRCTRPSSFCQR